MQRAYLCIYCFLPSNNCLNLWFGGIMPLYLIIICLTIIHTIQPYINSYFTCLLVYSSLLRSVREEPPMRRTRTRLPTSRRATNWATPQPKLSPAALILSVLLQSCKVLDLHSFWSFRFNMRLIWHSLTVD